MGLTRRSLPCVKKLLTVGTLLLLPGIAGAMPAVPGIQGFGSDTVNGSGRHLPVPHSRIYAVTSLAEIGPGTLAECLNGKEPRTCWFDVSGVIDLKKGALRIENPYIRVAGQTSPGGVVVVGCGIRVDTHDVLIEHIEIRPGDRTTPTGGDCQPMVRDALTIGGKAPASNIVVRQCSLAWPVDEVLSTYKPTQNITLTGLLLGPGLSDSEHPDGVHGYGPLFADNTQRLTLSRSLLAGFLDRNPRINGSGSSIEVVNILVYDYGGGAGTNWNVENISDEGTLPQLHIAQGNVYLPGPSTPPRVTKAFYAAAPINLGTRIYVRDVLAPARTLDTEDDWAAVDTSKGLDATIHRTLAPPFPGAVKEIMSARTVKEYVLAHAGSRPAERSAQDSWLVEAVRKGERVQMDCVGNTHPKNGAVCPRNAGGWPVRPTVLKPRAVPTDPDTIEASGRTRLEEELDRLSAAVEGAPVQASTTTTTTSTTVTSTTSLFPLEQKVRRCLCEAL